MVFQLIVTCASQVVEQHLRGGGINGGSKGH